LSAKVVTVNDNNHEDTIRQFKNTINDLERIPQADLKLMHAGKQLEDHRTLKDYNI